jgi:hypothetical protein
MLMGTGRPTGGEQPREGSLLNAPYFLTQSKRYLAIVVDYSAIFDGTYLSVLIWWHFVWCPWW